MAPESGSSDTISFAVTIRAWSSLPKATPSGVAPMQNDWTLLPPRLITDRPPVGQLTAGRSAPQRARYSLTKSKIPKSDSYDPYPAGSHSSPPGEAREPSPGAAPHSPPGDIQIWQPNLFRFFTSAQHNQAQKSHG